MKGKVGLLTVLVLAVSLFVNLPAAQAGVEPVMIADSFFASISEGRLDTAADALAVDAVIRNTANHQAYQGREDVTQLLAGWQRADRLYEIVELRMAGDRVELLLDISDHGLAWGRQKVTLAVLDGKIYAMDYEPVKLRIW